MSREDIVNTVLKCLRDVCKMKGIPEKAPFSESTMLIGSDAAVLDSLGVVLLLVQVEETLGDTQAALVQRLFADDLHSETVGSISDRVRLLMEATK